MERLPRDHDVELGVVYVGEAFSLQYHLVSLCAIRTALAHLPPCLLRSLPCETPQRLFDLPLRWQATTL